MTTEVQFIVPAAPEAVALERELWEPGEPVADIYGTPVGAPVRVVLPAEEKLLRPAENEKLLLMKVDKQKGENPLQVKTVWFVAIRLAIGLGLFTVLTLIGLKGLRRARPNKLVDQTSNL
jgi:hypothetical protein